MAAVAPCGCCGWSVSGVSGGSGLSMLLFLELFLLDFLAAISCLAFCIF